jgi:hypothetical protein
MQVIAHHGIGMDGDRETFGDQMNPRFDPGLAMFERAFRGLVDPTQESPPHASLDAD